MSDKIKTGSKGEELAAAFLREKGYEIVARNYRCRRSEIDLIVRKDQWLVFVEVKTRTGTGFGQPETFVTPRKAGKVMEGAEQFILDSGWSGQIRFDVVSIKASEPPVIDHFEDAFH